MKMIDEKIIKYCNEHSNQDSDILKELENYTFENENIPPCPPPPCILRTMKNQKSIIRIQGENWKI